MKKGYYNYVLMCIASINWRRRSCGGGGFEAKDMRCVLIGTNTTPTQAVGIWNYLNLEPFRLLCCMNNNR